MLRSGHSFHAKPCRFVLRVPVLAVSRSAAVRFARMGCQRLRRRRDGPFDSSWSSFRVRSQAFFSWRLHPKPFLRGYRPPTESSLAVMPGGHARKYSLRPSRRTRPAPITATSAERPANQRHTSGWAGSAGAVDEATADAIIVPSLNCSCSHYQRRIQGTSIRNASHNPMAAS